MCARRTIQTALREKRAIIQAGYDTRSHLTQTDHPDLFRQILHDIMRPQAQWVHRIGTIRTFHVVRGSKNKAFALRLRVQLETNRWVNVSWRAAILSEFPKTRLQACPIRSALRQCIRRQVCLFRRSAQSPNLTCQLCHRCDLSAVYHVDHEEPRFATLVQTFLTDPKNAADCPEPSAMRYSRNGRRTFPPNCLSLARRWCAFHQKHATLRILCRDCNLHRARE